MDKPKEHWEEQRERALEQMEKVWPEIGRTRFKLNLLQNEHDKHQALVYEAERHLVEVIILKPSESAKVRNTHWMKKIMTLSLKERTELARKLEGKKL